jgi:DNA-binding CsgD family transcriptional regulator
MQATVRDITDLAASLLDDLDRPVFPADTVLGLLEPWVDAALSNYARVSPQGTVVDIVAPRCDELPVVRAWWRTHPANPWFALMCRRDRAPVTSATTPGGQVAWRRHPARDLMLSLTGCDELAVLPLTAGTGDVSALTFGRRGGEFTAPELDLLRTVQPLLRAVSRHVDRMAGWREQLGDAGAALGACRDAGLTARELDVLRLLAEGRTAVSVARRLGCAPRTAEKHTANLYGKLGVNDRVSAVLEGQRLGLLPVGRRASAGVDGP